MGQELTLAESMIDKDSLVSWRKDVGKAQREVQTCTVHQSVCGAWRRSRWQSAGRVENTPWIQYRE